MFPVPNAYLEQTFQMLAVTPEQLHAGLSAHAQKAAPFVSSWSRKVI